MYLLYSLLLTIAFLILLPRFVFDALRHGKYAAGFRERTGDVAPLDCETTDKDCHGRKPFVVWLHCVSVGETQAARPVVEALLEHYPTCTLVVSTTTLTGQRLAREVFKDKAARVFYLPFDWAWSVRRTLERIKPSVVLLMETELWFRFLHECQTRRVPVALINGRLSEKSVRGYKLIRRFTQRLVTNLSLALMQTQEDAGRIASLGLDDERIRVSGNVKYDLQLHPEDARVTNELRTRFGFTAEQPLIVFASTHRREEEILLQAFVRVRGTDSDMRPRILIAPRHPERFAEVAALLESSGLKWARRSALPHANDATCDAVLLDSIGELRATYALARVVFVGGSLIPHGGQNILEPAASGACIVTGTHTANFAAIIKTFLAADALIQIPALDDEQLVSHIAGVFASLLADESACRRYGENARAVLEGNRGATTRTVEFLAPLLEPCANEGALDLTPTVVSSAPIE